MGQNSERSSSGSRVVVVGSEGSSFETPACRDMSRGIEWSPVFGIGSRRIMARKEIRQCKEDSTCDFK
jgi:hypothetical protein